VLFVVVLAARVEGAVVRREGDPAGRHSPGRHVSLGGDQGTGAVPQVPHIQGKCRALVGGEGDVPAVRADRRVPSVALDAVVAARAEVVDEHVPAVVGVVRNQVGVGRFEDDGTAVGAERGVQGLAGGGRAVGGAVELGAGAGGAVVEPDVAAVVAARAVG